MPTSADLLLDTSAAIRLVSPADPAHEQVLQRTDGLMLGLAGHAAFETLSVLTRLPGNRRLSPTAAKRVIEADFPASHQVSMQGSNEALAALTDAGIAGGAIYDGLVGLAAKEAGITLLSCD